MALRTIIQEGDSVLNKKCRLVTSFDDRLAQLLDDMKETLAQACGYGLAAPQVGILRRAFITVDERDIVYDEDGNPPEDYEAKYLEFINPEILSQEGEALEYEGCLSFPGHNAAIKRPTKLTVRAFNRQGEPFELEVEGMLARCVCHESNHLDGVTIMELAEYFYEDQEHDDEDEE